MNTPIYVDTSVFMDFFEDRDSAAYELIQKALRCTYMFIISDHTVHELRKNHHETDIENLLWLLFRQKKASMVFSTGEDKEKAAQLARSGKTHYADALHICLAERTEANCIVTKNTGDFVKATQLTVKRPDIL